jgi:hypothetical protein
MRFPVKPFAITTMLLFSAGSAFANELYIYPAKGQSSEQQEKDKFECYTWARNDTGFDPMAVPTTTTAAPSSQRSSGGAAKGALGGAALGAIFGSSSKTTKRSAVAGGVLGGVRQSSKNRQVDQERQQWEQKESANYANNRNNYNRAYSACLEGRGYTVR